MQIFVLNGGFGKRVRSISKNNPKCMIKFNKKPFIYHQIKLLKKKGFREIIFCLGYKSNKIINYLKTIKFKNLNIRYVVEKKKLGTGGALINSKKKMKNYFYLTYGDSYLDINYKRIYSNFLREKSMNCAMTVVNKKYVKYHKSNITLTNNQIIHYGYSNKSDYIDFGAIIFKKKIFNKKKNQRVDLKKIINELVENKSLKIFKIYKKFLQIGTIKGINEFKKYLNV